MYIFIGPFYSGWIGGIFNKLSFKPKNQMILPDDKNPSVSINGLELGEFGDLNDSKIESHSRLFGMHKIRSG